MPPMDSLPNPESLRTLVQRILNELHQNENQESVKWTDLLAPIDSNKDRDHDSVDHLVQLVTELPSLLISTLSLPRPTNENRTEHHTLQSVLQVRQ